METHTHREMQTEPVSQRFGVKMIASKWFPLSALWKKKLDASIFFSLLAKEPHLILFLPFAWTDRFGAASAANRRVLPLQSVWFCCWGSSISSKTHPLIACSSVSTDGSNERGEKKRQNVRAGCSQRVTGRGGENLLFQIIEFGLIWRVSMKSKHKKNSDS